VIYGLSAGFTAGFDGFIQSLGSLQRKESSAEKENYPSSA
jgi:hypothetical protein